MSLEERIDNLLMWKKGEKRAPHKPLLLLLAIGNVQRGGERLQLFQDIQPSLTRALELFGPSGRVATPQYPFWRLQHDGVWEVASDGPMVLRKSSDDPTKKALIEKRARAGFLAEHFAVIRDEKAVQSRLIHQLLDAHFPSSIHEDIIAFFDLEIDVSRAQEQSRAGDFRERVLKAYGWKCAVTKFTVTFQGAVFGVEPTVIRWLQAAGGTSIRNAIALTTLHRKLFHLGVFTIDEKYRVRISPRAIAEGVPPNILHRFDRKSIRLPLREEDWPDKESLAWHASEVFRG
jgi:putative restriction endonuclease